MKSLNLVTMAVIIGIAVVCSSCIIAITPIIGNGIVVTSARTVSSFEKIHISGGAEVRFHESQEYQAFVTVDSNLDEYVDVHVSGNVLNIGTKIGFTYSFTKLLVDVYCPTLTSVSVSGSGYFEGRDRIECLSFSAKISGSGRINVTGNSVFSNIAISGSGSFYGDNFIVNTAVVSISGSGNAYVYVTNSLRADISGSGIINYRGNPRIDSTISGSGRIRKI